MGLLILYVSVAIGVSFLCSILEAVVLSISPAYLYSLKNRRPKTYSRLWPLIQDIEKSLAAILSLNTVAHTIGAAGAGAQAQKIFGNEFFTTFSVVLTLAILFLSEIIPKSIGARYWKSLDDFTSRVLPVLITTTLPLVWISSKLSRFIKGKDKDIISRAEINAVADIALSQGSLEKNEHLFLKRLMKFRDVEAHTIMTKLENVYSLAANVTVDEAFSKDERFPFSRIPVYGIDQNDIKGYVMRSQLLRAKAQGLNTLIGQLYTPMLIVAHHTNARQLMFRLIKRREHIAGIISDEGNFVGIVTLEDIIEALLGIEIVDESDSG